MNWLDSLLHLNPEQLVVRHEPMTPRYQRAGQWLRYLVSKGSYLGAREHDDFSPDEVVEIAVWATHPAGGRRGIYACFRLHLEWGTPMFAVLFAFYDGTDRSPTISSLAQARRLAVERGFVHEDAH